jgi:hypothetical protein
LVTLRCPTGAIRWVHGRQFHKVRQNEVKPREPATPVES